jgi:hypothetical protein
VVRPFEQILVQVEEDLGRGTDVDADMAVEQSESPRRLRVSGGGSGHAQSRPCTYLD